MLVLPALFINKETNAGGLIQIIPFWITASPPLPTPAVFEQLVFISRAEAERPRQEPSLNVSAAGASPVIQPARRRRRRVLFPPFVLFVSGL